jgi:hypothetical protein
MVAAMNQNTNPHNVIAIDDKEINARSVGRLVLWSLTGGDVSLAALVAALDAEGSKANPPPPVTAKVALHRAIDVVAKELGCEAMLLTAKQVETDEAGKPKGYQRKRGDWAIVRAPKQRTGETGEEVAYPIVASARIEGDAISVSAGTAFEVEERLRQTFGAARAVLAPADIGHWLCDKLRALDAVPVKENGGVYFLPKGNVERWEKLVAALGKASGHKVFAIPSMRTQDAVEAILAAITAETRGECEKMAEEIATAGLGKRALETRETATGELLGRLERYEGLLGARLDDLRAAIEETRSAVTVAKMALGSDDNE